MTCEVLGLLADFTECVSLHFLSNCRRKIPAFCLLRNAFEREVFEKVARDLVCLFFSQHAEDITRGPPRFHFLGSRTYQWRCGHNSPKRSTIDGAKDVWRNQLRMDIAASYVANRGRVGLCWIIAYAKQFPAEF